MNSDEPPPSDNVWSTHIAGLARDFNCIVQRSSPCDPVIFVDSHPEKYRADSDY